MSTDLADTCATLVRNIDGAIACGVIDLETSSVLGFESAETCSPGLAEVVVAAAMDLFRGPSLGRIADLIGGGNGATEHPLHEVHVASPQHFHFAKLLRSCPVVVVLVT